MAGQESEKDRRNKESLETLLRLVNESLDGWNRAQPEPARLIGFNRSVDSYHRSAKGEIPLEIRAQPSWPVNKHLRFFDTESPESADILIATALPKLLNDSLELAYSDYNMSALTGITQYQDALPKAGFDRTTKQIVIQFPPGEDPALSKARLVEKTEEIKSHISGFLQIHLYRAIRSLWQRGMQADEFPGG